MNRICTRECLRKRWGSWWRPLHVDGPPSRNQEHVLQSVGDTTNGTWWCLGWVDYFQPEGRALVLYLQLPVRFGVKLRYSIRAVVSELWRTWRGAIEMAGMMNEWMLHFFLLQFLYCNHFCFSADQVTRVECSVEEVADGVAVAEEDVAVVVMEEAIWRKNSWMHSLMLTRSVNFEARSIPLHLARGQKHRKWGQTIDD